jgi:hypothetical protein
MTITESPQVTRFEQKSSNFVGRLILVKIKELDLKNGWRQEIGSLSVCQR